MDFPGFLIVSVDGLPIVIDACISIEMHELQSDEHVLRPEIWSMHSASHVPNHCTVLHIAVGARQHSVAEWLLNSTNGLKITTIR